MLFALTILTDLDSMSHSMSHIMPLPFLRFRQFQKLGVITTFDTIRLKKHTRNVSITEELEGLAAWIKYDQLSLEDLE